MGACDGGGHRLGGETGDNHANYEEYVNRRTSNYTDEFNKYLSFDGTLSVVSAYDATKEIANDTTFDNGQPYNCTWMNQNYNVDNQAYWDRAGESLNLAVNYLTDVLHTLYLEANQVVIPEFPSAIMSTLLVAGIFAVIMLKLRRREP